MLVRRWAQRLAEDLEVLDAQRDLAVATAHRAAVDPEQVAEVERREQRVTLLAEHVLAGVELDLAGAVDEVEEGRLARAAPRRNPPGDAMALVRFLAGLEMLVGRRDRRDGLDIGERVRESAWIGRAQPLALGAALGDQLGQAVFGGLWAGWIVRRVGHCALGIAFENGIQPSSRAGLRFWLQLENAPAATAVTGRAIRAR